MQPPTLKWLFMNSLSDNFFAEYYINAHHNCIFLNIIIILFKSHIQIFKVPFGQMHQPVRDGYYRAGPVFHHNIYVFVLIEMETLQPKGEETK